MPWPSRLALPLALAAALAASPAPATTVVHLDTPALVRGSDDIVVGEVEGTRSYWNPSRTKILTDVTIRVSRRLKGAPDERITLTQLGGEVGGVRYTVPGSPAFRAGERALLFVWRDSKGRPQVNGLGQGKFEIERDPASGEETVRRSLPGLAIRDVKSLAAPAAGARTPAVPLPAMLREIQRTLEEGGR